MAHLIGDKIGRPLTYIGRRRKCKCGNRLSGYNKRKRCYACIKEWESLADEWNSKNPYHKLKSFQIGD